MDDAEREKISISYQRAVRNCNEKAWSVMTPNEKVRDMQDIENYNAMQQNRIPSEVSVEELGPGTYGYQIRNSIVLSHSELNTTNYQENIDTIFHEGQHSYVRQSQWITEVREQFEQEHTPEEIQEIYAPVPNPEVDPVGYYMHPNEMMAREAGREGVQQLENDREVIRQVDSELNHYNQILETYDYDALSIASQQEITVSNSMNLDDGADITDSVSIDDSVDAGISMGEDDEF